MTLIVLSVSKTWSRKTLFAWRQRWSFFWIVTKLSISLVRPCPWGDGKSFWFVPQNYCFFLAKMHVSFCQVYVHQCHKTRWDQARLQAGLKFPGWNSLAFSRLCATFSHTSASFIYEWVTQTIRFIDHSFDMAKRLYHSMTPWAMQCRATQDGWVKSSEKLRPAGGGNGSPPGTLTWRTSQTVRKGRKIWHRKTSSHRSEVVRYATGKEWRAITHSSRRNEVTEPKQEWCSAVDVSGGESKVWCSNEWYCRGTWNVRSMNQGELDIVRQEMARLKTNVRKIEGKRRKGWQSTKCLDGITDPMDMNLSQTSEMLEDRRAWCATVRAGAESDKT